MNINLTLIGQTIMFAMFVWFCMKFIWPPIVAAMEERKKRIENGLIAAERGLSEQKEAQKEAQQILSQSKHQATEIISNANQQASSMIEEAKTLAVEAAGKIKTQAQSDLKQEVVYARNQLKDQLAGLVMQGVRAIVDKEVDEKTHQTMLHKLSQTL